MGLKTNWIILVLLAPFYQLHPIYHIHPFMQTTDSFSFVTANAKMADVLSHHNHLINLLPRLGVPLGFGEKTVGQVCEENHVSLPLLLLVFNVYVRPDFVPDVDDLRQCPIEEIVDYLKASHKDYLEYSFPHIENHLRGVVQDWNVKYRTSITMFFEEYKKEVDQHFKYEEKHVFPFVQNLLMHTATAKEASKVWQFEKQHSNIEDKLRDFTSLLVKYVPEDVSQRERINMLNNIFSLSDDIEKHAIIEEKILLPYIKILMDDEKL